jgi:hypothetical protein
VGGRRGVKGGSAVRKVTLRSHQGEVLRGRKITRRSHQRGVWMAGRSREGHTNTGCGWAEGHAKVTPTRVFDGRKMASKRSATVWRFSLRHPGLDPESRFLIGEEKAAGSRIKSGMTVVVGWVRHSYPVLLFAAYRNDGPLGSTMQRAAAGGSGRGSRHIVRPGCRTAGVWLSGGRGPRTPGGRLRPRRSRRHSPRRARPGRARREGSRSAPGDRRRGGCRSAAARCPLPLPPC